MSRASRGTVLHVPFGLCWVRVRGGLLVFEALGTDSVQCNVQLMMSRRSTLWRNAVMVTRSKGGNVRGLVAGIGLVMCTFAFTVLPSEPTALGAGVPAGLTQGFSEIVKQVTPAVVNIAVTGGGDGGGRGRRSTLRPAPFGGPRAEGAPGGDVA